MNKNLQWYHTLLAKFLLQIQNYILQKMTTAHSKTSYSKAERRLSDGSKWDRSTCLLSLTCLPVIALYIDTEHRNPLPLHIVVIEIDIWDGDVPGWEVSRGAGGGCCLHGGVILQHHHGFLHLEWKEVREVKVEQSMRLQKKWIMVKTSAVKVKNTTGGLSLNYWISFVLWVQVLFI